MMISIRGRTCKPIVPVWSCIASLITLLRVDWGSGGVSGSLLLWTLPAKRHPKGWDSALKEWSVVWRFYLRERKVSGVSLKGFIFFLVGILSVMLTNIDKMDDQTLDRRSAWSETTGIPLWHGTNGRKVWGSMLISSWPGDRSVSKASGLLYIFKQPRVRPIPQREWETFQWPSFDARLRLRTQVINWLTDWPYKNYIWLVRFKLAMVVL